MAKKKPAKPDKTAFWRNIVALVLLVGALFLSISLITYDSHDSGWRVDPDYPVNTPSKNACGIIGASLASLFINNIGLASLAVILLLFIWAIAIFRGKDIGNVWLRILGTVVFVFSISALIGAVKPDGNPRLIGGIGLAMGNFFAISLGQIGSIIIFGLFFVLSSCLVIDRLLFDLAGRTWNRLRLSAIMVKDKAVEIQEKRVAAAEKREAEREEENEETVADVGPFIVKPTIKTQKPDIKEDEFVYASEENPPEQNSFEEDRYEPALQFDPDTELEPEDDADEDPLPVDSSEEEVEVETESPRKVVKKTRKKPVKDASPTKVGTYILPEISMLAKPEPSKSDVVSLIEERAKLIESLFSEFKIDAKVVNYDQGPTVTQFELKLAPGIKINRVLGLHDNLSMALKATSLRIVAPIPGRATIGIEVPNQEQGVVKLRDVLESPAFIAKKSRLQLPVLMGKDSSGDAVFEDLAKMPHLLIAGATGSGKSVCLNSIIIGLLMLKSPDEVKMIMVDPKMVEMAGYRDIPHLMTPVVTDMKKAAMVMDWAVVEMESRYARFSEVGVRNILGYNRWVEEQRKIIEEKQNKPPVQPVLEGMAVDGEENTADQNEDFSDDEQDLVPPEPIPYVVVIVDELADLMMVAAKEIEQSITRLAQKSRATGIHIILATQRPSVDVITGLIKANLPSRMSFQVSSKVDSRTILDQNGAEKLLGRGDMLFLPPGTAKLLRAQGTYVTDEEIMNVVEYVKDQRLPLYDEEIVNKGLRGDDSAVEDDVYNDAVRVVLETQRGSVSLLQRKLSIGYTRAAKLIEVMESQGILGPHRGSKPREIYLSLDEWDERHDDAMDKAMNNA